VPEPTRGLPEALDAIGDRWSPLLVDALLDGPLRFGELQERLPGIAPNVLSQRLRALEQERVLLATPYSTRPRRYEYELTESGRALAGALRLLADWGARHAGAQVEPRRHAACGSPLEARWWCPACGVPVDADEGRDGEEEDEELLFA
jgi:DNA-binding HxlR family transcriptional regulator